MLSVSSLALSGFACARTDSSPSGALDWFWRILSLKEILLGKGLEKLLFELLVYLAAMILAIS